MTKETCLTYAKQCKEKGDEAGAKFWEERAGKHDEQKIINARIAEVARLRKMQELGLKEEDLKPTTKGKK